MSDEDLEPTAAVETTAPEAPVSEPASAPEEAATLDDALDATLARLNSEAEDEDEAAETDEPGEQEAAEADEDGEEPAETDEPEEPAIPMPQSWKADLREDWAKMPPKVQEWVAQREREAHGRISQMGQVVKEYEPIRGLIHEHRDIFESNDVTPVQGLLNLMAAERALLQDPKGTLLRIAQAYKVDLSDAGNDNQAWVDPEIQTLRSELADVKRLLAAQHQTQQQSANAQREQQIAAFKAVVDEFTSEHEDFAELHEDILQHVTSLRSANTGMSPRELLQEAYDRARWANPATRARLLDEQVKAAAVARDKEARERLAKAKQAKRINVNGAPHEGTPGSLDAALDAVLARRHG